MAQKVINPEVRENIGNFLELANSPIANYILIGLFGVGLILIFYLLTVRKRIIKGNYTRDKKVILKQQKFFANLFLSLIFGIIIILLLKLLSTFNL